MKKLLKSDKYLYVSIGDLMVTLEENLFDIEGFLEDGTPFSIKNLNYAVRDIINAKKNSAYTKEYFESLHQQYPNGIAYDANGTPNVRTIAVRATGGKITAGNTGEVIEVDLSDAAELNELKLDKKIDGLTPIESKSKDNYNHFPTKGENRQAVRAEQTDLKHANLIMQKRWKAHGYRR